MKKILLLILIVFPGTIYGVETSARSAILMDMDSNRILYEKNINEQRSVASISKIMTAILAIECGKLDDQVIVGSEIEKSYGSGIYIKQGESLTLRDLVYGLMLRSGNDAALTIANYVGGDIPTFVNLMNEKAHNIGMTRTIFNNPSGLDQEKGNYSTAYDMALLTSYAMKNDEYKKITSTKKYNLKTNKNTYVWINKNKMLSLYKYSTGGKTGYTEIAKRTLVSTATKDGVNLVVVTLNDGNDWQDHQNLFEYGFKNYANIEILKKGKINIYNEKYYNDYELYIKNDYSYLISNEEVDSLTIKYDIEKIRNIKNNTKIGTINVYLGDKKIYEDDIFVKQKSKKSKKLLNRIKDWFNNLW